jgi:hypothetical protein
MRGEPEPVPCPVRSVIGIGAPRRRRGGVAARTSTRRTSAATDARCRGDYEGPRRSAILDSMQPRLARNARDRQALRRLKTHSATGPGVGTVCTPDVAKLTEQPLWTDRPDEVTCNKCRKKLGLRPWFEYEGNE